MFLLSTRLTNSSLQQLVQAKLNRSAQVIASQQRDIFPIMGYSYYQYATELLSANNTLSALIFAENSLALSDLEGYFKQTNPWQLNTLFISHIAFFLAGFLLGIIAISLYYRRHKQ